TLLNSSYDIARELFAAINPKFQEHWKAETGEDVTIKQSHAGSSKQARAILQGLKADVVTFNQVTDVNVLHVLSYLITAVWMHRLSVMCMSHFLRSYLMMRKGNTKNTQDWVVLARDNADAVVTKHGSYSTGRWLRRVAAIWLLEGLVSKVAKG